jgi:hypothetical protein
MQPTQVQFASYNGTSVGYNYLSDSVTATGCTQVDANPQICGKFTVQDSVRVITKDNNWN